MGWPIQSTVLTAQMFCLFCFVADLKRINEWVSCCAFFDKKLQDFGFAFIYVNPASDVQKHKNSKIVVHTIGFVILQNINKEEDRHECQCIKIKVFMLLIT